MAKVNRPVRGEDGVWKYPPTEDVLKEVGLKPIADYIRARRDTIAKWVADSSGWSHHITQGRVIITCDWGSCDVIHVISVIDLLFLETTLLSHFLVLTTGFM